MTKQAFRQAFARGFAEQLAERGWTPSEVEGLLVKASALSWPSWLSYKSISDNVRAGLVDAKDVSKYLALAGAGTAGLAGGVLGYLSAEPQRVSDADLEALRDEDLIGAYRQAARGIKLPTLKPQRAGL